MLCTSRLVVATQNYSCPLKMNFINEAEKQPLAFGRFSINQLNGHLE